MTTVILNTYCNWIRAAFVIGVLLVATLNGQQDKSGLVVEEVAPDSAAAKAGIKAGDRLLTYDSKELISPAAFLALQENTFSKKEVKLSLLRQDQTLNFEVPIGVVGITTRPNLAAVALKLYEQAATAALAKKLDEAIAKLKDAALVSTSAGESSSASWLRGRAAEHYETLRQWKEAIAEHQSALDLLKASKDQAARSRTMFALGRCKQNANELTGANQSFEQARAEDTAAGNEMWVTGDLTSLGNVAYSRSELQSAQEYYGRALAIRERLAPNSLAVADSLNRLGVVVSDQGKNQLAKDYYSRSLTIRERLAPNSIDVANCLNNLGTIADSEGELQAAHDYYSRALVIKERVAPNSPSLASTLNNLGGIASDRSDLKAAELYYSRALAIKERLAPDSRDVAISLNSLGSVAHEQGDLNAAQDYLNRALEIFERVAPKSLNEASTLNNLGGVASDQADLQAAQDYYSRAYLIIERLTPNSPYAAAVLNNLGKVALSKDEVQAAHDYFRRALEIQELQAPNSLPVAIFLSNLGEVANAKGDLQVAQDYIRRSLAIKEPLAPNSLTVAMSLAALGSVVRDKGDLQAAHDYFRRALEIHERLAPNSLTVAEILNDLGDLSFKEHRFADARSLFTRAVNIVEQQRSKTSSTETRALLLARYAKPFTALLRTHLELNDLPAAFATSERARARGLVEMLAERKLDLRSDAPAELIKQQDELDQKRSAAYSALARLDAVKANKQIDELRAALNNYELQQRELAVRIRRASPKLANLQYPAALDLDRTQAAIDPGTLLLSYYVDEQQTYLFAVTKQSLKLFRLPVTEAALNKQVTEFQNQVSVQRLGNSTEQAHRLGSTLYEILVGPAEALVKQAKRVLICPDGSLQTLPFAALVSQVKPKPRYFSEDKPLHTIVSMTVYAEIRQPAVHGTKQGMRVLAFGDPVYTREQVVQIKSEQVSDKLDRETANLKKRGLNLDTRLPHTRKEVEEIASLFGKSATIKLDKEATETNVRLESKDNSVIHFAVHGWLDEQIGLNSGLVLSRPELLGKQATKEDNGLLQAWEILEQLKFDTDLVVLSACESGLGQRLRGEGLIGLTRAIQYAGARSVVVSLWGVNDESTAAFMQAFYSELKRGASKDVALQKAMTVVRSNSKWSHPFYWSPFILAGSWN